MNEKLTIKSKWFWGWNDDKEEAWLTEMAKQGLHLKTPALFGKYTFSEGAPRDMVYRLDFVPANKKDEFYFQLFRDAGWEHVGELSGWQYWRKEVKSGEIPEIFTDPESKIQKYKRLLGFLAIVFFPICMSVLINIRLFLVRPEEITHWIDWVFVVLRVLYAVMALIYAYIFIQFGLRIRRLKRM